MGSRNSREEDLKREGEMRTREEREEGGPRMRGGGLGEERFKE